MKSARPTETREEILASIGRLKDKLDAELAHVLALPTVTPEQKQEVRDLVGDLGGQLAESASDVTASPEPLTTWRDWFHQEVSPRLTTLSGKLFAFANVPPGCCFYDGRHFPSSEDECTLTGSTWSPTPCPSIDQPPAP